MPQILRPGHICRMEVMVARQLGWMMGVVVYVGMARNVEPYVETPHNSAECGDGFAYAFHGHSVQHGHRGRGCGVLDVDQSGHSGMEVPEGS